MVASLDPAMGGPPMVVTRLAAAQARLGHEVSIFAYLVPQRLSALAAATAGVPDFQRVSVTHPPLTGALERFTASRMIAALDAASPRPDVLHLHGVWERCLPRAARWARRRGIAYVIAPHGMLDPWSLRQSALKKKLALALGYRAMLHRAAFLHLLNDDEAALLAPLGLRAPGRVIPNGVFLQEIEPLPAPGRFRAAHPLIGPGPIFLFLSRLHYKKGLDLLAQAFAQVAAELPQSQLVVAGPDEGAGEDFQKRIVELGLGPRTHRVGPLYGRAKFEAMADAHCFVLPSRQEGFSVAITEAMAVGTPVVISHACHFPQVAQVGAGLVTSLEPAAIAKAMLAVRPDMGVKGSELVRSRYTWPAIAELAVDHYRRAIDCTRRGVRA